MVTNLLQEIRDLLKGIYDYMDSIKESVDNIAALMEALELIIENIDQTLTAIANNVEDIKDDVDDINTNTTAIKNNTDALASDVAIMKQNDIDHYLAEETVLNAIKVLSQTIATAVTIVKDTILLMQPDVAAIKADTTVISNYSATIADNTGNSAAFLEDIATNTLDTYNRVASISADTTEIIAVLRQIRDEIHTHGGT